jgi:hypothetical protein
VLFKFLIKDKFISLNFDVFYSEFMPKFWKLSERLQSGQSWQKGCKYLNRYAVLLDIPLLCEQSFLTPKKIALFLRSGHFGGKKSLGPLQKPHEIADYMFYRH